jgi:chemotaxis protein MotB
MSGAKGALAPVIIVNKKHAGHGHHGGAWKIAYADFVTAMMAFFLVMWLVGTVPQDKLAGISEYFLNPSAFRGKNATPSMGAMGSGGSANSPVQITRAPTPPTPPQPQARAEQTRATSGDAPGRTPQQEEIERLAKEIEQRQLDSLKRELEAAIRASQALAPFKDQLLLDITSEGLRIQIVDEQNRPMFDLGSSRLKDYTTVILDELAEYLNKVPNRVSISGHTDDTPFAGANGYTNWELSADRANAARRALVAGGFTEAKMARVVGLSSSVLFDKTDPRNPINRRISIIVMNKAAEEAVRRGNSREPDASDDDPRASSAGPVLAREGGPVAPIALPRPIEMPGRPLINESMEARALSRTLEEQGLDTESRPR